MTDRELIKLNINELTEEHARVIGMELLEEDIDADKAAVKRNGIIAAILSAAMVAAGMDNVVAYGIMGVDSMFLMSFFNKLQTLFKNKRTLKKFENNTYEDGYVAFVKMCQEFVAKRYSYLDGYNEDYDEEKGRSR